MGFTFGRRRADAHQDSREIPAADKAPSEILREIRDITFDQRTTADQRSRSDQRTDTTLSDTPRGAKPSLDSTARPANLKEDQFRGVRPSFGRRASRALTRFLIAGFISVGSILAWQSYGDAAKENVASWAPQLGWVRLLPTLKPPPDIAPVAPAARFSDGQQQQLNAISLGLAAVRQSVDRLAVGVEQIPRNIASLETAENDIRSKISAPKPAATAPPRSPALKYPPPVTEILLATSAKATEPGQYVTVNALLRYCDSNNREQELFCRGYLSGITDTIEDIRRVNKLTPCLTRPAQAEELKAVVIKFVRTRVRDNAQWGNEPAVSLASAATGQAWCPSQ